MRGERGRRTIVFFAVKHRLELQSRHGRRCLPKVSCPSYYYADRAERDLFGIFLGSMDSWVGLPEVLLGRAS